jgi:tRNA pseudouridine38-40 synthase
MVRYAAEVSYNGAFFFGWQVQPERPSVQLALEDALSVLNGNHVNVIGAGRTDAGVHAKGQVCSFDMAKKWDERRLLLALNANLPQGVSVLRIAEASPDFHARYDALSREYIYFIWTGSTIYPHVVPFTHWIKGGNYDWDLAGKACQYLEGEHYFGNFCRASCKPQNAVRTMYSVRLRHRGSHLMYFRIKGDGFLTNMVRIILGDLELIAKKEKKPEWIKELFDDASDRTCGGRTFPPTGLFLWKIQYKLSPWK